MPRRGEVFQQKTSRRKAELTRIRIPPMPPLIHVPTIRHRGPHLLRGDILASPHLPGNAIHDVQRVHVDVAVVELGFLLDWPSVGHDVDGFWLCLGDE